MSSPTDITAVYQLGLTVSDLDGSRAFYEDKLGLRMVARFDPPGLMFFYAGGVRLSLQKTDSVEASSSVVYFQVADIEAAVAALKDKGVAFEQEAQLVFPDTEGQFGAPGEEEWMAFLRDPDGHLLALVSRR
ncbi:MAG: VOC family protein [Gammaproteobacteria bacterium]|nr:VOC family protein [Gammaproteobacteria bacterium]